MSRENEFTIERGGYWIPVLGGLVKKEDEYFQRYQERVLELQTPEELLREQNRLDKQGTLFERLGRGGLAVGLGVVASMWLTPEFYRSLPIPLETLVGGVLTWAFADLTVIHIWWMTDIKKALLTNRFPKP